MNRKGFTLTELVISVVLISVVMMFLFQLLTDLEYSQNHASYAKSNQINRAKIIENIQKTWMSSELLDITEDTDATNNKVTITFKYNSSSEYLYINYKDNIITYNDESWTLQKDNDSTKIDVSNISIDKFPTTNNTGCAKNTINGTYTYDVCPTYRYLYLHIPIVTGTTENTIDDIDLFYVG